MATAQAKRLANGPVYGSLAYDLDFMAREYALQHAGERVLEQPRPTPMPKRAAREQARLRTAQRLDPLPVLGLMAVGAVLLMILISYVTLNSIAARTVQLNSHLQQLQSNHDVLLAEYERTFDMESIKAAAAEAGMSKPSKSQIFYSDLSGVDTVTQYKQEQENVLEKILSALGRRVLTAVEYFR